MSRAEYQGAAAFATELRWRHVKAEAFAPMVGIQVLDIHKCSGTLAALKDVGIDITSGEIVVLAGPSVCGKSTFLRVISGLDVASVRPDPYRWQGRCGAAGRGSGHRHGIPVLCPLSAYECHGKHGVFPQDSRRVRTDMAAWSSGRSGLTCVEPRKVTANLSSAPFTGYFPDGFVKLHSSADPRAGTRRPRARRDREARRAGSCSPGWCP